MVKVTELDRQKPTLDRRVIGITSDTTRIKYIEKKQCQQRMSWFFTFNNYLESQIVLLINKFNEICTKFIFQKEKGKGVFKANEIDGSIKIEQIIDGTNHLQGVIFLHKKMRPTEFDLPKEIHWEGTRNKKAAIDYCQKTETSQGCVYAKGIELNCNKIKILDTKSLYPWQKEFIDLTNEKPNDRTIYWLVDIKGAKGKSQIIKKIYLENKNDTIMLSDTTTDNIYYNIYSHLTDDNGNQKENKNIKNVIFDLPRGHKNSINSTAIENIKNGLIINNKYKGGSCVFNSPNIFILANNYPSDKMFKSLTEDRWKIGIIQSTTDKIDWLTADQLSAVFNNEFEI